jgi:plasmid rolling circle replication initiator protein Rep
MNLLEWERVKENKSKMIQALVTIGKEKEAIKIDNCTNVIGVRKCTQHDHTIIIRTHACKQRFCPTCSRLRYINAQNKLNEVLDNIKHPYFLTLTVPNVKKLTKQVYRDLRKSFRKLVKECDFISGGVYSIETTYNEETETWHPHIHCIIDGLEPGGYNEDFIQVQNNFREVVRSKWLRETGGHQIQWRYISHTNKHKVIAETLKYVAKFDYLMGSPELLKEFLDVTKGMRLLQTFGTFYNYKLELDEISEEDFTDIFATEWERMENLSNKGKKTCVLQKGEAFVAISPYDKDWREHLETCPICGAKTERDLKRWNKLKRLLYPEDYQYTKGVA